MKSGRPQSPGKAPKRKEAEAQRLRTKEGYKEYRQTTDNHMGATVPAGLDATMTLTSVSDMKTAFDMLDERKEGALDRMQARKWLRCAGWCVTDEVLDEMLNAQEAKGKKMVQDKRAKWGLRQLTDIADSNRDRENSSVDELQRALRRLAGNKSRISRDRLLEFTVAEKGLKQEDLDEVLDILGLGGVKILDCDEISKRLLYRVCNPPSVFEQQTY
jgi:Ca2+-binding EF-hand superfamily protein